MKKLLLALLVFSCLNSFAQSTYAFKSGGEIFQNGTKIAPNEIRNLLVTNQIALDLYKTGRTKKTFGNLLLSLGFGTLIGKLVRDSSTGDGFTRIPTGQMIANPASKTLYYIGGAMIIIAIPIKIGFSNKIRKAVDLMNDDLKNPKITHNEATYFIVDSKGIGVSIKF